VQCARRESRIVNVHALICGFAQVETHRRLIRTQNLAVKISGTTL
jgi:hypothetical protein